MAGCHGPCSCRRHIMYQIYILHQDCAIPASKKGSLICILLYMTSRSEARTPSHRSQRPHGRDRYFSELRREHESTERSRSREDNKSVRSNMSQRSNRSGPVIFGGNSVIRKTEKVEDNASEILSRAEFRKPTGLARNIRDRDLEDEYAAWAW